MASFTNLGTVTINNGGQSPAGTLNYTYSGDGQTGSTSVSGGGSFSFSIVTYEYGGSFSFSLNSNCCGDLSGGSVSNSPNILDPGPAGWHRIVV